jgi:hypothetical protein
VTGIRTRGSPDHLEVTRVTYVAKMCSFQDAGVIASMFIELANQSKVWELSPAELERLSKMNLHPVE